MDHFTYCYYIIFASICQRRSAIFKKFMVITNVSPWILEKEAKKSPAPWRCGGGKSHYSREVWTKEYFSVK